MSLPRRQLPGQTHMITRRCVQRRLLLTSSPIVDAIVRYCLALCLSESEVQLYAFVFESNHYHMLLGDPEGKLSKFVERFDCLVARALNAHYGRGEAFWKPGSFNNTEIHDQETLIEKLVYVYLNPVKDGLVARPEQWPGLKSTPEDMGRFEATVDKPLCAFFGGRRPDDWKPTGELTPRKQKQLEARLRREANRARGAKGKKKRRKRSTLPASATLEVQLPPEVGDRDAFVAKVRSRLELEITRVHMERELQGKLSFMGAQRVLAQDPHQSAGDTFPTFARDPRISCVHTKLRIKLLLELKAWRAAYKAALAAWRSGKRKVVFPKGTYKMRQLHRCKVGEVPLLTG